jgi:hypothetical protein
VGLKALPGDKLAGTAQGIPELAGAVGKAGYHLGTTSAGLEVASLEFSVENKEFWGVGRASPAQHPNFSLFAVIARRLTARRQKDYNIVIES